MRYKYTYKKPKTKGRRYKYSLKQMRYWGSISNNPKKQEKWLKKIYKQKAKQALRQGNVEQAQYYKKQAKQAKQHLKQYGIKKQEWRTVASSSDLNKVIDEGILIADKGTMRYMVLDNTGQAEIFLYETDAAFNEVTKIKASGGQPIQVVVGK